MLLGPRRPCFLRATVAPYEAGKKDENLRTQNRRNGSERMRENMDQRLADIARTTSYLAVDQHEALDLAKKIKV